MKTWKTSPPVSFFLPSSSLEIIVNLIRCPLSVLYITPSSPFSMVTVDIFALTFCLGTTLVTTPKDAILTSISWWSLLNVNPSLIHGSNSQLAEFKSCKRLDICLHMFKISTLLPFSSAVLVKSKLLCTPARAVSSFSCWISRDLSFANLNFPISEINWLQRLSRQAVRWLKQLTTSSMVRSAWEFTFFFISRTPSTASLRKAAFASVLDRISNRFSLPFIKASLTKVYLWSRCFMMMQSLQIASSHVSQNNFITSPSCSLHIAGFVTAADPIFLASSRDNKLWELVLRPRRWAWVQNSQRKWEQVAHLLTGGSPLSQTSHSREDPLDSSWRATTESKLLTKKLAGSKSTSPWGICAQC